MRSLLIASAALVALSAVPAAAKDYQWCQRSPTTGGNPQCSFTSFRQCQATVSGAGGDCIRNPRLAYGNRSRRH
ncbi:DUF3551 domain-containing protein [Tardiphaga sp.]|uniref:DUF3551 domain-containing protein n=1 Tax=Tardiphaga sp. TaxID=1926292 RepID=UPI002603E535|nr:DUF3551 domain-containing protein [Tardiphaga sp.]